jgi:hypothetical protein
MRHGSARRAARAPAHRCSAEPECTNSASCSGLSCPCSSATDAECTHPGRGCRATTVAEARGVQLGRAVGAGAAHDGSREPSRGRCRSHAPSRSSAATLPRTAAATLRRARAAAPPRRTTSSASDSPHAAATCSARNVRPPRPVPTASATLSSTGSAPGSASEPPRLQAGPLHPVRLSQRTYQPFPPQHFHRPSHFAPAPPNKPATAAPCALPQRTIAAQHSAARCASQRRVEGSSCARARPCTARRAEIVRVP